ncbi:MAG: InlB B-repeat-containing protein, partial [Clostridiales bacterium]|nr:InlB B-repeat-containing protein [Clostridiales bacterium]
MKLFKRTLSVIIVAVMVTTTFFFTDVGTLFPKGYEDYSSKVYSTEYYSASTTFIKGVCIGYDGSSMNTIKTQMQNAGWTTDSGWLDLMEGWSGTKKIGMGYKTTTNPQEALTGLKIFDSDDGHTATSVYGGQLDWNKITKSPYGYDTSSSRSWIKDSNYNKYYRVGGSPLEAYSQDGIVDMLLGMGSGYGYIYLCATKESSAGAPIIEVKSLGSTSSSYECAYCLNNQCSGSTWHRITHNKGSARYVGYKRCTRSTVTSDTLRSNYTAGVTRYNNRNTTHHTSESIAALKSALDTAASILADLQDGYTTSNQTAINNAATAIANATLVYKTYTITLNNNSATSAGTTTIYEKYNTGFYSNSGATSSITSITKPSKTGYTFGGYGTNSDGTGTSRINSSGTITATNTTFTANTTIYAKWTANTYTVTYGANGGSGTAPSNSSCIYNVNFTTPANPYTKTGYHFGGWNTKTDGTGTNYSASTSYKNLTSTNGATVNLYAKWIANTYTVTYNANGGTGTAPSNTSATYDVNFTTPANPFTKVGYDFGGWNKNTSGTGTNYSASTSYKNLTSTNGGTVNLYAKWVAQGYTLTYNANGGTVSPTTKSITFDSAYGTLATPSRTGYTFNEWYTQNPSNVGFAYAYNSEKTFSGGKVGSNFAIIPRTYMYTDKIAVHLEAYRDDWSTVGNQHLISCTETGGWGMGPPACTGDAGGVEVYVTGVGYKEVIYNFRALSSGWHAFDFVFDGANQLLKLYVDGAEVGRTATGGSTITYNSSNAIFLGCEAGNSATSASSLDTYGFNGKIKNVMISNTSTVAAPITSATKVGIDSNHTVYAKWTPHTYTVTYGANGGTGTAPSNTSATYDVNFTTPANPYTKTGYHFDGWNTATDGTGDNYAASTSYSNLTSTNGATVDLYAKWAPNTDTAYTVYHYQQKTDGTYPTAATATENKTGTTATTATASAKSYTGFTCDTSINGTVSSGTIAADGSLVLKLYYKRNTYSVKYNKNDSAATGTMSNSSHTYGVAKNLSSLGFSKTGWHFLGWATTAAGNVVYTDGQSVTSLSSTAGDTVNLYAKWEANTYTVTYNKNGADGTETMADSSFTYDTAGTIRANSFTYLGYTFTGWTGAPASGSTQGYILDRAQEGTATGTSSSFSNIDWNGVNWKLNDTFKPNEEYTVVFEAKGSGTMQIFLYEEPMNVGCAKAVCSNGTTQTSSTMGQIDLALTGTYTTYTITYTMASTGTATANKFMIFRAAKGTSNTAYVKNVKAYQSKFTDSSSMMNLTSTHEGTYNLTAQWTANEYKVAFDANVPSGSNSGAATGVPTTTITVTYKGKYPTLPTDQDVSRKGYTFDGWYTDPADGTLVVKDHTVGDRDENITTSTPLASSNTTAYTLFAHWTAKTYTIHFDENKGSGSSDPSDVTDLENVAYDGNYSSSALPT